ncbi:hypothetical protein GCM10027020_13710 [Nocardioides salsibiostraticola]
MTTTLQRHPTVAYAAATAVLVAGSVLIALLAPDMFTTQDEQAATLWAVTVSAGNALIGCGLILGIVAGRKNPAGGRNLTLLCGLAAIANLLAIWLIAVVLSVDGSGSVLGIALLLMVPTLILGALILATRRTSRG